MSNEQMSKWAIAQPCIFAMYKLQLLSMILKLTFVLFKYTEEPQI